MATHAKAARLAVDIGGTFTDVVVENHGQRTTAKVLTTPRAPEEGVLEAIGLVLARAGLSVTEYGANHIKKSVVGAGHADKVQVQSMVARLLPGIAVSSPDAADALAVAICHAHHSQTSARIQGQTVGADAR